MTNWTIFKIIFFHFYLYSSVLSHNYSLHIKNPLYNVKKTLNIEKKLFSLYFWGAVFSKITNSNAQKWVIFRKKIFTAKLVLGILATFWGVYFLNCHRRPTLMVSGHCKLARLSLYSPSLLTKNNMYPQCPDTHTHTNTKVNVI